MTSRRIWIALWALTLLLVAALCQAINRQADQIVMLKADLAVSQYFNAQMSEGIQYLAHENQILGEEMTKRPNREYLHY